MPKRVNDQRLTVEEVEALKEWIHSRPASVQERMRKFPPGCIVRAASDAPLCEEHAHNRFELEMAVGMYPEEGDYVGCMMTDGSEEFFRIPMEYLEIVAFRNGVDQEFVDNAIKGN